MSQLGGLGKLERLVPERIARSHWMRPRYPLVAVELREDAVIVSRLARRKGRYHLAGHGRKELPEGVFRAAVNGASMIGSAEKLEHAIGEALKLAGAESTNRISLALPDTTARAFLLDLQEIPASREQAQEVIRWRLKKSVPFDLTSARLAWQELGRGEDGRVQLLVTVVPGEGLAALEGLLERMGFRVGLIDLATLGAFNALRLEGALETESRGDIAILTATGAYFSLMILRGGHVIFYRAKNYHVQGGFLGEESLRVVGRELRSSLSYYEEHLLGEGVSQIYLRVVGIDPEAIDEVVRAAGCETTLPVSIGKTIAELQGVDDAEVCELLPTVGLALRREP